MLDVTGKELKVGDNVVFTSYGASDLSIGTIMHFTPEKARISRKSYVEDTIGVLKQSHYIAKVVL